MAKQIKALELNLTAEEEAAVGRVYESLKGKGDQPLKNMARMMAAKHPRTSAVNRRFVTTSIRENGKNHFQETPVGVEPT